MRIKKLPNVLVVGFKRFKVVEVTTTQPIPSTTSGTSSASGAGTTNSATGLSTNAASGSQPASATQATQQVTEQKYVKLSYRVAFPMELRLFNTVDAPNPHSSSSYRKNYHSPHQNSRMQLKGGEGGMGIEGEEDGEIELGEDPDRLYKLFAIVVHIGG